MCKHSEQFLIFSYNLGVCFKRVFFFVFFSPKFSGVRVRVRVQHLGDNWLMYGEKVPGGATRMARRGGIRLVHGLTKSTLITYFSGMKKDPKYAFFLNLPVMFFPKFVYMTKNTPFFPILHIFAPLNNVRAYSAWSWKTTLIMWIFGRAWYPSWHSSAPPPRRRSNMGVLEKRSCWSQNCRYTKHEKLTEDPLPKVHRSRSVKPITITFLDLNWFWKGRNIHLFMFNEY